MQKESNSPRSPSSLIESFHRVGTTPAGPSLSYQRQRKISSSHRVLEVGFPSIRFEVISLSCAVSVSSASVGCPPFSVPASPLSHRLTTLTRYHADSQPRQSRPFPQACRPSPPAGFSVLYQLLARPSRMLRPPCTRTERVVDTTGAEKTYTVTSGTSDTSMIKMISTVWQPTMPGVRARALVPESL